VSNPITFLNLRILGTSLSVLQASTTACECYNIEIQKYTNVCLGSIGCNKNCCEVNTKTPQNNPKTGRRQSAPKAAPATKQQSWGKKATWEKATRAKKSDAKARSNKKGRGERVDHILNSMWAIQSHFLISAFLALARLSCRPLLLSFYQVSSKSFRTAIAKQHRIYSAQNWRRSTNTILVVVRLAF